MLLNDIQITDKRSMITPFIDRKVSDGVISYGLSSFGYDIRIADEFRVPISTPGAVLDPKHPELAQWRTQIVETYLTIPPNSFVLGKSVEYMDMPKNVMGIVLGKSTYARLGIIANFTPLEPGWRGYITIEISNTSPLPAKIYANEGIAQVLFFEGKKPDADYGNGKYQDQLGIAHAIVNPPLTIAEAVAGVQRAARHSQIDELHCQCGHVQTARGDDCLVLCSRCGAVLRASAEVV